MEPGTFQWTPSADQAFTQIKQDIVNSPALSMFDLQLPTVFMTHSSGYGLGAILTQIKDGQEVLVCCASRKLSDAEKKYSAGEREALGCLWAIEKWHTYLWGKPFELCTDHKSLVTLLSTVGTGLQPMRISRWSARLMNYNYTVTYKRGHDNTVADALSRLPMDFKEKLSKIQISIQCVVLSLTLDCLKSYNKVHVKVMKFIKMWLSYVTGFWQDKRNLNQNILPYFPVRDELTVHNGIIFRDSRVVVPSALQSQIVDISHEGHQGVVPTKQGIRQLYWWPKMDKLVYEKIKNCVTCQLHDKSAKSRTAPMQPVSLQ